MKGAPVNKKSKNISVAATIEEFPVFLAGFMHAKRKTPKEFAAFLGVSPQLLYMLRNGSRSPSQEILKKIGLEVAYRIAGTSEVIALEDLKMFIVAKLQDSKLDLKGYAAKVGIHEKTLYTIIAGIRPMSKSLIKQYGLENVYVGK
jgi:transcriptional regulator with XRE-family HTH domain